MVISGHLLYCFMLFYFLFYTDGDLRTFTLLFYVVFIDVFSHLQIIWRHGKVVRQRTCRAILLSPQRGDTTSLVFLIIDTWKLLAFQSFNPINVIPETGRVHLIRYLRLYEDYWIDTSDGGHNMNEWTLQCRYAYVVFIDVFSHL
jgi:hypothetical protein